MIPETVVEEVEPGDSNGRVQEPDPATICKLDHKNKYLSLATDNGSPSPTQTFTDDQELKADEKSQDNMRVESSLIKVEPVEVNMQGQ